MGKVHRESVRTLYTYHFMISSCRLFEHYVDVIPAPRDKEKEGIWTCGWVGFREGVCQNRASEGKIILHVNQGVSGGTLAFGLFGVGVVCVGM